MEKYTSEILENTKNLERIRIMNHKKKNLITFHYTGWLIEFLILVYYNPYITG